MSRHIRRLGRSNASCLFFDLLVYYIVCSLPKQKWNRHWNEDAFTVQTTQYIQTLLYTWHCIHILTLVYWYINVSHKQLLSWLANIKLMTSWMDVYFDCPGQTWCTYVVLDLWICGIYKLHELWIAWMHNLLMALHNWWILSKLNDQWIFLYSQD